MHSLMFIKLFSLTTWSVTVNKFTCGRTRLLLYEAGVPTSSMWLTHWRKPQIQQQLLGGKKSSEAKILISSPVILCGAIQRHHCRRYSQVWAFQYCVFHLLLRGCFDSHDTNEGLKKVGALVHPKVFLMNLVSEKECYYTDGSRKCVSTTY